MGLDFANLINMLAQLENKSGGRQNKLGNFNNGSVNPNSVFELFSQLENAVGCKQNSLDILGLNSSGQSTASASKQKAAADSGVIADIGDFTNITVDTDGDGEADATHDDVTASLISEQDPNDTVEKINVYGEGEEGADIDATVSALNSIAENPDGYKGVNMSMEVPISYDDLSNLIGEEVTAENVSEYKDEILSAMEQDEDLAPYAEEIKAIENVTSQGIPVYIAGGNDSESFNLLNLADGATSVGGADEDGNAISEFGNDSTIDEYAQGEYDLNGDGTAELYGTSFAAPTALGSDLASGTATTTGTDGTTDGTTDDTSVLSEVDEKLFEMPDSYTKSNVFRTDYEELLKFPSSLTNDSFRLSSNSSNSNDQSGGTNGLYNVGGYGSLTNPNSLFNNNTGKLTDLDGFGPSNVQNNNQLSYIMQLFQNMLGMFGQLS